MAQYNFKLPDIGEGTAEAEIVAWHVKDGDRIEEDQPLVDMMTEKATVELTSPVTGTVLTVHGAVGETAAVGSVLVTLDADGVISEVPVTGKPEQKRPASDSASAILASAKKVAARSPAVSAPEVPRQANVSPASDSRANQTARPPSASPPASPAVRRRAEELGVKLQFVKGSGPDGRIVQADLDSFIAGDTDSLRHGPQKTGYSKRSGVEDIPVVGMRRQIAERMQLSKRHIPHFSYVEEVDVTELEELRRHLNSTKTDQQPKLTLLPFLMRALVNALPDYPQINATFDDDASVVHRHVPVHIGIATQTPKGLMVPVVRHAEARDPWENAAEIARLAAVAREGKASRDELTGATITITSLGPLGGVVTTPIINRPEVAIIGPNKIMERLVLRDGQTVTRQLMNLSSSFDHRVVDGYDAAEFIQKIKAMLEHPTTLFLC